MSITKGIYMPKPKLNTLDILAIVECHLQNSGPHERDNLRIGLQRILQERAENAAVENPLTLEEFLATHDLRVYSLPQYLIEEVMQLVAPE